MSYLINPVEEDRCVFLSYEGEMPAVELSAARYEANGVLNRRRWKRIVVDVTSLRSVPSSVELFDFASGFSSGIPPETRVALVVLPEQERHAKIIETAARKRGVTLNSFLDPEKATAWVKKTVVPQSAHFAKREKAWS